MQNLVEKVFSTLSLWCVAGSILVLISCGGKTEENKRGAATKPVVPVSQDGTGQLEDQAGQKGLAPEVEAGATPGVSGPVEDILTDSGDLSEDPVQSGADIAEGTPADGQESGTTLDEESTETSEFTDNPSETTPGFEGTPEGAGAGFPLSLSCAWPRTEALGTRCDEVYYGSEAFNAEFSETCSQNSRVVAETACVSENKLAGCKYLGSQGQTLKIEWFYNDFSPISTMSEDWVRTQCEAQENTELVLP